MNKKLVAKYVTKVEDGFMLKIPLENVQFAGVKVTEVCMFVSGDDDDGDGYCDGDLAVLWDADGLENTGGGDTGTLIMRGDDDDVGEVMSAFYWDDDFTSELQEILVKAGFSDSAARDVTGSEWGMQDEGRASYDAYAIAEEVRSAMGIAVKV